MNSPTVLIIEDDVDTRDMLSRFLELEGYTVHAAANGRQALEMLERDPSASVIVLDLMMPVMDGWEFRRRQIQDAHLKNIPTIVVSDAGLERLSKISADAYLSKPVDMDELLEHVSQYCSA
jgi:CheY-like chemotaxis protein